VHGLPTTAGHMGRICRCLVYSPLACRAWHGYKVTMAHRVEVEVGADGPPSVAPSGAAVAAPPAGAVYIKAIVTIC
jgi:hypothetical protein